MLFFYIRHGDPIYDPDSLTPLGHEQAEALSKRLAKFGLDKIYSSTSVRARQTAAPTCEKLGMEPELIAQAHEDLAFRDFTVLNKETGRRNWMFVYPETKKLLSSGEVRGLGDRWYDHPAFKEYNFKSGIERVYDVTDGLLGSLGYEHDRFTGSYRITRKNDERVALFAHAGFGLAFLSCLLDIPYPQFSTHFDMTHTGMTVIDFPDLGGYSIPRILTFSSDGHIYKEGLPTRFANSEKLVF